MIIAILSGLLVILSLRLIVISMRLKAARFDRDEYRLGEKTAWKKYYKANNEKHALRTQLKALTDAKESRTEALKEHLEGLKAKEKKLEIL